MAVEIDVLLPDVDDLFASQSRVREDRQHRKIAGAEKGPRAVEGEELAPPIVGDEIEMRLDRLADFHPRERIAGNPSRLVQPAPKGPKRSKPVTDGVLGASPFAQIGPIEVDGALAELAHRGEPQRLHECPVAVE